MKQEIEVAGQKVEQETVLAVQNNFEAHPEAYRIRVFVHVLDDGNYYEILAPGQAVPWGKSPEGNGFDFWIIDVASIHDFGVHREKK
jgi:ribosomal protein L12E/L44/L45/RPP1/RPP2